MSGLASGLALVALVAIAAGGACGNSSVTANDGAGAGGTSDAAAGGGGGTGGSESGGSGGGSAGSGGGGGSAGSGVAGGGGGGRGGTGGGAGGVGRGGTGGGGGSGGSGGSGGGGAGCVLAAGISCGNTQVCVTADCTRGPSPCIPITCVPNSNCCQASISCTAEGGGTGCRSPIQTCTGPAPTPVCANIGAGCTGAPTCACLPINICPAGQVCVGVNAMRVVTCAAL